MVTGKQVRKQNKTTGVDLRKIVADVYFLLLSWLGKFFRNYWKGLTVVLVLTVAFFWPLIMHIGTYSEGGDAMFNAWTLNRNHHCLLRDGCPDYTNANIYFPHEDTMLYSETQLSTGLVSLPLFLVNKNPVLIYNIMTILSFLLAGWFMYLLAKRLSKGNEIISILSALVFEFAPIKIAAISHLQNLSIFYLPLIFLLMLKFVDTKRKRWLVLLLVAMSLQFYASWYQMVFVLIGVGVFLAAILILGVAKPKLIFMIGATTLLAVLTTLPLAKEYIRFSKENEATFSIQDQVTYSSSLADYVIPNDGTLIGKLYYKIRPDAKANSFNPDSYSYHGVILYAVTLGLLVFAFPSKRLKLLTKKEYKLLVSFVLLGAVGFIISLGPLLKVKDTFTYELAADGLKTAIPLPYLLVTKLLPQLSFIRAIGRASILCLFALCSVLAFLPLAINRSKLSNVYKKVVVGVVTTLIIVELLPMHTVAMVKSNYSYNFKVPNVYKLIESSDEINNIVILNADRDYPGAPIPTARAEWVLWAGYHNKNIFNGYSGYTPPKYFTEYDDFVDFAQDDVIKMKSKGLKFVLVDKLLSSSNPRLAVDVSKSLPNKVYEDERYALFGIDGVE